jgi:hypothetical protein
MTEIVEKEVVFKRKSIKKFVYLDKYQDKVDQLDEKIEELDEKISKLGKQLNIAYALIGIIALLFIIL